MHKSNATQAKPNPPCLVEVGTLATVRAKLILAGWPSMKAWAEAHGYERVTLSYTVKTWGKRTDRGPHGGVSKALMRDLRRTLETGQGPQHEQIQGA